MSDETRCPRCWDPWYDEEGTISHQECVGSYHRELLEDRKQLASDRYQLIRMVDKLDAAREEIIRMVDKLDAAREEIERLKWERDAAHEDAESAEERIPCALCADPDIGGPVLEQCGDEMHWHHYIDPGDGLASKCGLSHRFDDVTADLREENERLKARNAELEKAWNPVRERGAERLADAVFSLVQRGLLDTRSAAADALLDYRGEDLHTESARAQLYADRQREAEHAAIREALSHLDNGDRALGIARCKAKLRGLVAPEEGKG